MMEECHARLFYDGADLLDTRRQRRQRFEPAAGRLGDQRRQRGLARAGRAVEDDRRRTRPFDQAAHRRVRLKQVVLADDFVEGCRPHPHGQRAGGADGTHRASGRGRLAGNVKKTVGHALCLPRGYDSHCVTKSISSSTRPMSAGSRSSQSRTWPRMRCQALAMSACSRAASPSARHTPFFHSTPRGTAGHSAMASRAA